MSLKDLEPGQYEAYPQSWGVAEVEKLGNKIQAVVRFRLSSEDETMVTWKDFFLKKDGTPNLKTLKTLMVCGFKSNRLSDFPKSNGLDKEKLVVLTLSRDEKGFLQVDWVNEPGSGGLEKLIEENDASKRLTSLKLDVALSKIQKDKSTNRPPLAPDTSQGASLDESDDFPF